MVEHSPKILASKEKATTTCPIAIRHHITVSLLHSPFIPQRSAQSASHVSRCNIFAAILTRYVPPLKPATSRWSLELPDNTGALEEELAKQESLLNQLHARLNAGRADPQTEEQLWEVQRVVTQLKRKVGGQGGGQLFFWCHHLV